MSRPFKVGDAVWDKVYGFGTVVHVYEYSLRPVCVASIFCETRYTRAGFRHVNDAEQALFHSDEVKDGKVQK